MPNRTRPPQKVLSWEQCMCTSGLTPARITIGCWTRQTSAISPLSAIKCSSLCQVKQNLWLLRMPTNSQQDLGRVNSGKQERFNNSRSNNFLWNNEWYRKNIYQYWLYVLIFLGKCLWTLLITRYPIDVTYMWRLISYLPRPIRGLTNNCYAIILTSYVDCFAIAAKMSSTSYCHGRGLSQIWNLILCKSFNENFET